MLVRGSDFQLTGLKSLLHAVLRPVIIASTTLIGITSTGMGLDATISFSHAKDSGQVGTAAVTDADVYVAGTFGLAKNGVLLSQYAGAMFSVYVTESDDVYAAGRRGNDAVYYKNGIRHNLPRNNLSAYACASSIHVSDIGGVCVAAYEYYAFEHGSYERFVSKLWRNNIEQTLAIRQGADSTGSQANSVFVSGNNVYVAGCVLNEGQLPRGVIWRNGIDQNWGGSPNFMSVVVSGSSVYVGGERGLWKDKVRQNLQSISPDAGNRGSGNSVCSIHVSDGKVYAAGHDWDPALQARVAVLWINGVVTRLGNGSYDSGALSVHVYDSDVYVVGFERNEQKIQVAMLWKVTNGNVETMRLSDGTSNQCANSVMTMPSKETRTAAKDATTVSPSVYVAGDFENFGLLKDGAIQSKYAGELYSVYVTGANEVYAAGYFGNEAVCYKNGTRYAFPRNSSSDLAEAKSVHVSDNGDVYMAGRECYDSDGHNLAKLWRNGTEQALAFGSDTVSSAAYSVYVSDSDVYVAGYEHNGQKQRGVLWKNGVDQNWGGDNAFNSVFVSSGSVYVGGEQGLWKDKVRQKLQSISSIEGNGNTHVCSIYVSSGKVHAVGQVNDRSLQGWVAVLWIDGVATRLGGSNSSYANSVHVHGNDVYVAGYEVNAEGFKAAKLWKVSDGSVETTSLSEATDSQCAWSVFVR